MDVLRLGSFWADELVLNHFARSTPMSRGASRFSGGSPDNEVLLYWLITIPGRRPAGDAPALQRATPGNTGYRPDARQNGYAFDYISTANLLMSAVT